MTQLPSETGFMRAGVLAKIWRTTRGLEVEKPGIILS